MDELTTALNTIVDEINSFVTQWNAKQGGASVIIANIGAFKVVGCMVPTTTQGSTTRNIVATSGSGQSATVFTQPTNPLVATVTDGSGQPVVGETVTWSTPNGGQISATSITNASGQASVTFTLGTGAGTQTFTATTSTGTSVDFTATATAAAAATIEARTATSQSAQTSTTVAVPPSVVVKDVYGNVKSGTNVTFAVTGGGGSGTSLGPTASDASGIVTVGSWTVGAAAGLNTMTATSAGLSGSPVTFLANGTSPNTPTILTINSGGTQSSVTVNTASAAMECKVTNDALTAQQGVTITYEIVSGAGNLSASTAVTNASGLCSVTYTPPATPTETATIRASGTRADGTALTNSPVTFTITSVAGAANKWVIITQPSASAQDGVAFTQQPILQITDANGNATATSGVTCTAAKASGSGTLGGTATAITNASGRATFSNLSFSGAGSSNTIQFSGTYTAATSATVSIAPPFATKVQFATNPTAVVAGSLFSPVVTCQLVDDTNAIVTTATDAVTVGISSGGTLLGTVTVNAVSGVATFSGLGVTSGTPAASYTLSASASGLTGATSASFAVTASSNSHPNEPAGLTRWAEVDFSQQTTLPSNSTYALYGDAGYWFSNRGNLTLNTNASGGSNPGVGLRQRMPGALGDGNTPSTLHVRPTASGTGSPAYSEVYMHMKGFRLGSTGAEGGDGQYEENGNGTKLWWFRLGTTSAGSIIICSRGPGAPSRVVSQSGLRYAFTSGGTPADVDLKKTSTTFQTGVSYDVEIWARVNTVDVADGELRVWVDGTEVNAMHITNGLWRITGETTNFYECWFDMTWGGGGGGTARSRADDIYRRYIYLSGK